MIDLRLKSKLLTEAKHAMSLAYAPYSHFSVGAALLTTEGKVYRGANIENASYRLTSCAEHNAIIAAILADEYSFCAICVIANTIEPVSPCGACRQIMSEFAGPDFEVLLLNTNGKERSTTLAELLPYSFTEKDLDNDTKVHK